jgi:O-antigen ligase
MKYIPEYLHYIFVLTTIMMVYILSPVGNMQLVTFILMGVGALLSFVYRSIFFSGHYMRIFKVVYGILFLNIFYQMSLGLFFIKTDDWLYLFAKYGTTAMLVISIVKNPQFYFHNAYKWLGYLLVILFVIGGLFTTADLTGRLTFGLINPNVTGTLASFTFGVFLLKTDIKKSVRWTGMLIVLFVCLACGSRTGLVMLLMSFIFRYKLSNKLVIGYGIGLCIMLWMVPYNNIENAFARFWKTVEEGNALSMGREDVRQMAIDMIKAKFWTGWGLSGTSIVDASVISVELQENALLGAHNGYLSATKMYGIFGALLFWGIILFRIIYLFKNYFRSNDPNVSLHLFVISSVLVAAFVEDYLVGINAIMTILFFTSVSILEYFLYYETSKTV